MEAPSQPLPRTQQRNFRALAKHQQQIARANEKLRELRQRRHETVLKIFDELENDPTGYIHVVHRGKADEEQRLTRATFKKLRKQYEAAYAKADLPNPHGGPGCDECPDIFECWCVFGAGPLCCYLCFSWKVIRCFF